MSHLCLIALVSVLFAGFAEAHPVQVEVEGHKEHLSIDVPPKAKISELVAQVKKEVREKLELPEEDIKNIQEKSVQTKGKKKGQDKLGNILGGEKIGKKSANKINKVLVRVAKANAKGGKNAHQVLDQNDELEAGAGEAHANHGGEGHAHPGKHPLAGLSGEDEKGGDADENVDSGAAGNDKA